MSNKQIYEYYNSTNEAINFKSSIKNFLLRVYPQAVVPEIKYLRDLPKTAEVLELGCGDGHVLEVLGKMGYERILGVELANNYKRRHPNIVHGDLVSHLEGMSDASVDAVLMLDVLEHFEKKDVMKIVRLIHQKLRPGGRFIARVPNIMSWNGMFNQFSDLTHQATFTEVSLSHVLRLGGFDSVQVYSSEKWIKLWLDPRRWPGFVLYCLSWGFRRIWRLAFGGPQIYTLNLAAVGLKSVESNRY